MIIKELNRDEIYKLVEIDRSEIVEHIYYYRNGELALEDEYYDIPDWSVEQKQTKIQITIDIFDRGGTIIGALEGDLLVGLVSLDTTFIGENKDLLNMAGLWVSKAFRKKGIASKLVQKISDVAKTKGAKGMYISATPSKNTVEFYLNLGCKIIASVDPRLFDLEPEDIHLELRFS